MPGIQPYQQPAWINHSPYSRNVLWSMGGHPRIQMALPLLFAKILKVNENPTHAMFNNVSGDSGFVHDHPELHQIPDISVPTHHAGWRGGPTVVVPHR
jgi:hypothetical protein